MFNIYTFEKNQHEKEKRQKEKLKIEKYTLKRKSKYILKFNI
jgi:hypothetical protein